MAGILPTTLAEPEDEAATGDSPGVLSSAAIFIEREISDFLGVTFVGHPDPRRLLKARAFGDDVHPLRRDFDVREFKRGIGAEPEF